MKRIVTSIALVVLLATAVILSTDGAAAAGSAAVRTSGIGWCGTC